MCRPSSLLKDMIHHDTSCKSWGITCNTVDKNQKNALHKMSVVFVEDNCVPFRENKLPMSL